MKKILLLIALVVVAVGCESIIYISETERGLWTAIRENVPTDWELIDESYTNTRQITWVFGLPEDFDFLEEGIVTNTIAEQAGYALLSSDLAPSSSFVGIMAIYQHKEDGSELRIISAVAGEGSQAKKFVVFWLCPCQPNDIAFEWL